jgi:hypothetical protein
VTQRVAKEKKKKKKKGKLAGNLLKELKNIYMKIIINRQKKKERKELAKAN